MNCLSLIDLNQPCAGGPGYCSDMAMKLYGLPMSTNTARVIACLNEKDVEYELVPVDLRVGAHKQDPFISLNVIRLFGF